MKPSRLWLILASLALSAVAAPSSAQDSFPSRPVQVIVPAGAGSAVDISTRIFAEKWQEALGQPVVIVNVVGAAGAIGISRAQQARPDGYTVLSTVESSIVTVPIVSKTVKYDVNTFDYLNGFGAGAIYFESPADAPEKTLGELFRAGKAGKPLSYASYGVGTIGHFAAEMLWEMAGVPVTHIPYKSSPEAEMALLGGQVNIAVTGSAAAATANPRLRILAIANDTRRADYPEIPTLKEQGFPISVEYLTALLVPKGLPPEVRRKLADSITQTHVKYADLLKAQFASKADLVHINQSGAEVLKQWQTRQERFRAIAPRMNLE